MAGITASSSGQIVSSTSKRRGHSSTQPAKQQSKEAEQQLGPKILRSGRGSRRVKSGRSKSSHRRIAPDDVSMVTQPRTSRRERGKNLDLTVDTKANDVDGRKKKLGTPQTAESTPTLMMTPTGVRGSSDLRSPGAKKTPRNGERRGGVPPPDFMTQTDADGNATTPRSKDAISNARRTHPSGPEEDEETGGVGDEVCETLLDNIRLMCCCLLPEDGVSNSSKAVATNKSIDDGCCAISTSDSSFPKNDRVRLLPKHHPDDFGKKCLVLDLDETLVHSSFHAVSDADFVIPVHMEDVVHFVYVAKRPGVDEFLTEMAKHYEIIIYTASLSKYADPLLDLLDPNRVIRTRLFRESCVFCEGNYVKDLSLIDRDLTQAIIIDNSPNSYIFHPENAIDCSSFIDDPADRELDQIGTFLAGIKDVKDVRHLAPKWRDWPKVDLTEHNKSQEQ